jgi:2-dehydro-3-deoxyphosphogluconate aldolase / (4S)-4-hydroxy-2-oxoglutarate aldolase
MNQKEWQDSKKALPEDLKQDLLKAGIIAVLELDSEEYAIPVARALVRGGVTAIELALRTKAAQPSIELIAKNVPEMMLGIGTIIFPGQVVAVQSLGARFGVSPGFNPTIMQEALDAGLPFAPGIATPSELEAALAFGCDVLKLFPAESLGGIPYLKSMNNPYKYLGLTYIPLGGVTEENLVAYAEMPEILAIGGTWIAKRELIKDKNWDEISRRAEKASKLWQSIRRI